MRIAFSGAHRTGKTTLIEAVSALLPAYEVIDEPYRVLEDEGYELSDPPSREDFERQLRLSIETIRGCPRDALLDRSPLDFVAYLQAMGEELELEEWQPGIREAMDALDAVVLVAIETPDRIAVPAHEDRRLRREVDEILTALLVDDPWGLGVRTIEVQGSVDARGRQVMRAIA